MSRLNWSPCSWRTKTARQQPVYDDPLSVSKVTAQIRRSPSLVSESEIDCLRSDLSDVQSGRSFLLHAGECAERFHECTDADLHAHLAVMGEMMARLRRTPAERVVGIGRIAGQYAKPRSDDLEYQGDRCFPSFRGDIINGDQFDSEARRPDPQRRAQAYAYSAATLNFIRANGEQIIQNASAWAGGVIQPVRGGLPGYYTSHEALLLEYEEALTRRSSASISHYNVGAHFLWVGMRTNHVDASHIEYVRGLANPVGFKVGPETDPDMLAQIAGYVNPSNEAGRIVFIMRCGRDLVESALPKILSGIERNRLNVLCIVDPMHGNTERLANGFKTRRFDKIFEEFEISLDCHRKFGIPLGGIHLELSGGNVTECLGGPEAIEPPDLARAYFSRVDPRLSKTQAFHLADLVARTRATEILDRATQGDAFVPVTEGEISK